MMNSMIKAAVEVAPAGGSETRDILLIGAVVSAGFLLIATVGLGHRLGRTNVLNRIADYSGRKLGMPGWAALPIIVAGALDGAHVLRLYVGLGDPHEQRP